MFKKNIKKMHKTRLNKTKTRKEMDTIFGAFFINENG